MESGWLGKQLQTARVLVVLVVAVAVVVKAVSSNSVAEMEANTIECLIRQYSYEISQPYRTPQGDIYMCMGKVTVDSCWGRCDSSEIADYKVPYKMSIHPVCTYKTRRWRTVNLTDCDPRHPKPTAEVFDAVECACSKCTSDDTSCENING